MERTFNYDILAEIKKRWSARAISKKPIPRNEVLALIEAARYAPSCFNEQPWRFLIADEEKTLTKMRSVLTQSNQVWANNAPVLLLIASNQRFSANDKENYWHMFDAGTAWGFLSLEAQRRGLVAHAMGGFNREKAREVFNIPGHLTILTIVAIGRYGKKEDLPPDLQEREHPELRREAEELLL